MKTDVLIFINTERSGISFPLDDLEEGEEPYLPEGDEVPEGEDEPESAEMMMEGTISIERDRVELSYEESELTGMEGSVTVIGFSLTQPDLVSMVRSGAVSTALVFEPFRRHVCVYNTPFSSFEVCVHTVKVENRLLSDGDLFLDYLIEIHGTKAERCKMKIHVKL